MAGRPYCRPVHHKIYMKKEEKIWQQDVLE